ncbi:hypothetical protein B0H13DRAFT_935349 [Mycena leptocephala]|nr:hypothetical protein B0H13DRAFT_935349 [Mycena leptocephala]
MHPSREIIPRELIERACHETSCTHTKLRGYAMSFCKACQSVFYCSVACQRKDWPHHKSFCRMQAAAVAREAPAAGRLSQVFEAWRLAMGPPMFSCLVVGALELHRHPENKDKKFVVLFLREKEGEVNNPAKAFEYEGYLAYDWSKLNCMDVGAGVNEIMQHARNVDEKTRSLGGAGGALVQTMITAPDDTNRISLVRFSPVVVGRRELEREEDTLWELGIAKTINEGISIRNLAAKKGKKGMRS